MPDAGELLYMNLHEEEDGLGYVSPDTAVQPWRFGPPGRPVVRGIDILTVRDGSVSVVRTLIGFRRNT